MRNELNIGIIGAGKFSHHHARAIQKIEDLNLKAACRSNEIALNDFCNQYQISGYQNYRDLLQEPEIDAVLISTPHHLHTDIAIDAARAGKHILLEKPFAPTLEECKRINAESKTAQVKLMLGHITQFTGAFREAKHILQGRQLGEIVQAIGFTNTLWMGPDRKEWHLVKSQGGGYLLTLAVHQIDAMLNLVNLPVESVRSVLGAGFHESETDDFGTLWINFKGSVVATIVFTGYTEGVRKVEAEFYCRRGMVRMDVREGTFIGRDEEWKLVPNSVGNNWLQDALVAEWRDFAEAIFHDRDPLVNGDQAIRTMEVIDAAVRSSSENREIWL